MDLADIAGMLDDLANECLVSASYFAEDALDEIDESAIYPPLVENAYSGTEWWAVRLDHAECAMNGPENEEYYEEMVQVPESFEIRTTRFLN